MTCDLCGVHHSDPNDCTGVPPVTKQDILCRLFRSDTVIWAYRNLIYQAMDEWAAQREHDRRKEYKTQEHDKDS